jgi:two-component system, OmpR family, response regulator
VTDADSRPPRNDRPRAGVASAVPRILIADDEAHIREVVAYALTRDGFEVATAGDGRAALAAIEAGGVDLVVLDVLMPELDGLAVCRALRGPGAPRIPIIFLSSRGDEVDRVNGLELGGDDYVTKPFSPRELATRVRAVLRRAGTGAGTTPAPQTPAPAAPSPVHALGRLRVDLERHEVVVDGVHRIDLTATELRLLAALCERPGRVLSRAALIARAHGRDHHITARTIDTHIRHIRAKLERHGLDPIATVHGVGYKCEAA